MSDASVYIETTLPFRLRARLRPSGRRRPRDRLPQRRGVRHADRFTDGLIDRVVYRLYGVSEEEVVAVVEGTL